MWYENGRCQFAESGREPVIFIDLLGQNPLENLVFKEMGLPVLVPVSLQHSKKWV